MKISIIIPVYNSEKSIESSIRTLLMQSYDNFEIIVVDDNSTDNTNMVLESLSNEDGRINYITSDKNSGAGYSRNVGLKYAKGDYLIFLDGDDRFIDSNSFLRINERLESEPDVLLMKYQYSTENFKQSREPKTIYELSVWDQLSKTDKSFLDLQELPETLLFPAYPWNKVYKRSFVENNNITFSETRCHNDLKFSWHAMIAAEKIAFLAEPMVQHDIDDDRPRITNNRNMNRMNLFRACQETEDVLKEYEVSDTILSYYQKFKWDAFNWGKFRIMEEGIWPFIKTYHKQLLKTPLKERWFFFSTHAISNLERIKFLMICYIPFAYYLLFRRNLNKNEA